MPPNAVLERLRAERGRQISFVDELLANVSRDERDLVDAETANLTAAQERIQGLNAQIGPLEEYEALVETHRSSVVEYRAPREGQDRAEMGGGGERVTYRTPGAFIQDLLAARGLMSNRQGQRLPADPQAQARINYVLANQTTADTPGILPDPVVGTLVNLIDASRPFISSIGGARPMGGIPGKTFGRPKITQHVLVGEQTAEKTELPSQKMVIGELSFTKRTYGGAVDVSRQDIDWTSPAAWDILIRDLADIYAQVTENAAADDFVTKAALVNAPTTVAENTLEGWSAALYAAAGLVYAQSKRLPDRLWVSTDVWGAVGPVVDLQLASAHVAGSSDVTSFAGNLWGLPRIVVPSFPAGTAIIGASNAYEVYEEVIGLLTAVEPSLLGVEVAYGGYIAFNAVYPEGLAPLTAPVLPLAARSGSGSSSSEERSSSTKKG